MAKGKGRGAGGRGVATVEDVLTPFQEAFCLAYTTPGPDGKQRSGGACAKAAGYSENGADVQASMLLRMPKILARIDALRAVAAEIAEIDAAELMQIQARIARKSRSEPNRLRACAQLATMIPGAIAPTRQDTHLSGEITLKLAYDGGRTPRRAVESGNGQKLEKATDVIEGERMDNAIQRP